MHFYELDNSEVECNEKLQSSTVAVNGYLVIQAQKFLE
jgi:hypothetical protein